MPTTDLIPYLTDPNGKEHFISADRMSLGRAVENDIVILDKRASREHACIWREGRRTFLEDRASTNGTFLNGERVLDAQELRDGDRVTIGDVCFHFRDPDTTTRDNPLPDLEINLQAGVVRVNRSPITLSPKEFALLAFLYERRGKVCSKDEIGSAVWAEYQQGVFDYQIENLVRRLRSKIENEAANPQLLLTVRGLGYKLVAKER
jgi:DNA-binding response OmpR family regulator